MSKNVYLKTFISVYIKIYNQIKKIVYQIPEEPVSKRWCNTIAIYRKYIPVNNSRNPIDRLISNIYGFFCFQSSKNWIIFENLSEFRKDVIDPLDYKLSIIETTEAKKTIEFVKRKYSHLSDPCLKYNLFILKNSEYYFTKLIYQCNSRDLLFPKNNTISNVKFMTIEYVHPSLKTPLIIDLSPFKFAVNSDILNFLFIYWYLRTKYGNWTDCIFDMKYKLNIIDGEFRYFEISSLDCITLEENNYKIRETYGFPGRPFPFSGATEGSDIQNL